MVFVAPLIFDVLVSGSSMLQWLLYFNARNCWHLVPNQVGCQLADIFKKTNREFLAHRGVDANKDRTD